MFDPSVMCVGQRAPSVFANLHVRRATQVLAFERHFNFPSRTLETHPVKLAARPGQRYILAQQASGKHPESQNVTAC